MALIHLAKAAGTSTGWPHQQKGGRVVGVAFRPVGAAAFFADGVNLPLLDDALHGRQFTGITNRSFQPGWQIEKGGVFP